MYVTSFLKDKFIILILFTQKKKCNREGRFMTNINLLQGLAPGSHPQGFFQIKRIHDKHANLGMHCSHWIV
jgi:hypothetical protein